MLYDRKLITEKNVRFCSNPKEFNKKGMILFTGGAATKTKRSISNNINNYYKKLLYSKQLFSHYRLFMIFIFLHFLGYLSTTQRLLRRKQKFKLAQPDDKSAVILGKVNFYDIYAAVFHISFFSISLVC